MTLLLVLLRRCLFDFDRCRGFAVSRFRGFLMLLWLVGYRVYSCLFLFSSSYSLVLVPFSVFGACSCTCRLFCFSFFLWQVFWPHSLVGSCLAFLTLWCRVRLYLVVRSRLVLSWLVSSCLALSSSESISSGIWPCSLRLSCFVVVLAEQCCRI